MSRAPTLSAGKNGTELVYITEGAYFRSEKYADECSGIGRAITHTGWYTDLEYPDDKLRGIVARLPHGLFLAGYEESFSGMRIWYPAVHHTERDAALMADEHARVEAERECEYNAKLHEARALETLIEDSARRLRECFFLRNRPSMSYVRDEVRTLVAAIRDAREQLTTDYKEYL